MAKRRQLAAAGQAAGPASEAVPPPPANGGPAAGAPPAAGSEGDLNLVGERPAGAAAESYEQHDRAVRQSVQAQVQNALNEARSLMSTNPDFAKQRLREVLEQVRQVTELSPEVRDQYEQQMQAALREAERRKVEFEEGNRRQQAAASLARERQNAIRGMLRNQQKVQQLMARFDSLMDEGKYRFAEEVNSAEAAKLLPAGDPLPHVATFDARTIGYYQQSMANRTEIWKAFCDTLYQADKSAVPFPDDPPIVYPDAESLAAVDEPAQGPLLVDGRGQTGLGRKEDRGGIEVANPVGFRRAAAGRCDRVPEGPPRHRNSARREGADRRGCDPRHAGHQARQGHQPALGPAADVAQT